MIFEQLSLDEAIELAKKHSDSPMVYSQSLVELNKIPETADEAIERAAENANADWTKKAMAIVENLCETHYFFTTDELWEKLDHSNAITHEPRAVGAIMRLAARKGWCKLTDQVKVSNRPVCHGRRVSVWASLLLQDYKSSIPQ